MQNKGLRSKCRKLFGLVIAILCLVGSFSFMACQITNGHQPVINTGYKAKSIEEVLRLKEFSEPQFTEREKAAIANEQKKLVDEHMKREFDELAAKVLKPWLDLSSDSPLVQAVKEFSQKVPLFAPELPESPTPRTALVELRTAMLSSECSGIILTPPYTTGSPLTEFVGADAEGPGGFKTHSVLAIPSEGVLSVGVANGRLLGINKYPSSDSWFFGDANSASASILHVVSSIPGAPLDLPTKMEVTIDVVVGDITSLNPVGLIAGSSSSTGNGVVGVMGMVYLTLYGSKSIEGPRTKSKRFLFQWTSALGGGASEHIRHFSLSETLGLKPGAQWIAVGISVGLMAFRAGVDDPSGGFSGIDLRAPYTLTHGLWVLQPPAGPIRVPNISITFCPLEFIPVEMFE